MESNSGQDVSNGVGPNGSHERATHAPARTNSTIPNASITSENKLGSFAQALAFRSASLRKNLHLGSGQQGAKGDMAKAMFPLPVHYTSPPASLASGSVAMNPTFDRQISTEAPRAPTLLGYGFQDLPVNHEGRGATSNKPGKNGQEAQSGKGAPTASRAAREIQRYRPPQSAAVAGHQALAPEPAHPRATMHQTPLPRRPSSHRVLQNPEVATAILSIACQIRRFNPAWVLRPTSSPNRWSFSVMLGNQLVPSAGEFPTEKKAKAATALKAVEVVFSMGVSRDEVVRRFLALPPGRQTATPETNHPNAQPPKTLLNQDVTMTGSDGILANRPMPFATGTSSGGLPVRQSIAGRAPISNMPIPSARAPIDESHKILESLGLVARSSRDHTQPPEMSTAFLQGLAAGAQLSQILFNKGPNERGRSSRSYRERDRQPRRDRRSRSPPTERQLAAVARPHDTSSPPDNYGLRGSELRPDYYPPTPRKLRQSTDRYRPSYDSKMPNTPDVVIKTETSTTVGGPLEMGPAVTAGSSGSGSHRRNRTASAVSRRASGLLKPMPKNEKWGHDGFAGLYPSDPKL